MDKKINIETEDFIRHHLTAGKSDEQVIDMLVNQGYDRAETESIVTTISLEKAAEVKEAEKTDGTKNIIFGVIFIVIGVVLLAANQGIRGWIFLGVGAIRLISAAVS